MILSHILRQQATSRQKYQFVCVRSLHCNPSVCNGDTAILSNDEHRPLFTSVIISCERCVF